MQKLIDKIIWVAKVVEGWALPTIEFMEFEGSENWEEFARWGEVISYDPAMPFGGLHLYAPDGFSLFFLLHLRVVEVLSRSGVGRRVLLFVFREQSDDILPILLRKIIGDDNRINFFIHKQDKNKRLDGFVKSASRFNSSPTPNLPRANSSKGEVVGR